MKSLRARDKTSKNCQIKIDQACRGDEHLGLLTDWLVDSWWGIRKSFLGRDEQEMTEARELSFEIEHVH